jgi:magnesium chelatase family protein
MSGPLLDRIDIRVPVGPTSAHELVGSPGEPSAAIRLRVEAAIQMQEKRYRGLPFARNARLQPDQIDAYCRLAPKAAQAFEKAVDRLSLSSRACHSILKTARTIADLSGTHSIGENELLEAIQHRRFGEGEALWPE